MVGSGQLRGNDLVWKNGMANWSPVNSVPELAPPDRGPPRGYDEPGGPPPFPSGRPSRYGPAVTFGGILLFIGAGLLFVAFFTPWWGITHKFPEDKSPTQERIKELEKSMTSAQKIL